MHVAVIGAGIVGVTTAYELAVDGHRVTVFERCGTVAAEASFAHAGVINPGWLAPWAVAERPPRLWELLLRRDASGRPRRSDTATAHGRRQRRRAGGDRPALADGLRVQSLARYSQARLHRLTLSLRIDYERADGCLVLLRTAEALSVAQQGLGALLAAGTRVESLDAAGCRGVEPGLSEDTPLAGGLWFPDGEVGNCRQFASVLRQEAERLGVRFRFHSVVQRIEGGAAPQVTALHAPPGEVPRRAAAMGDAPDTVPFAEGPRTRPYDAIVVCAALGASALLRPHGLRLPLQAVHGHSITAPLRHNELHPDLGPRAALIDDRHQVAISRIGGRVRVAGGTEIGGSAGRMDAAVIATLHKVLHDWFPGAAQIDQAQRWKGARPVLPDGLPVIGASGVAGLWLNLGHGSLGWTLACGSARLLADRIAGRVPEIDAEGLGAERLGVPT